MKRIMAAFLVLTLAMGLSACGPKTKTIYVQTQSLRTIAGQEIRSEYTYAANGTPLEVKTYFNDVLYQTASTRTSNGISYLTVVDREGNESTQSTMTAYDDRGNVSQVEIAMSMSTVSRTTYTYDDQDRMLSAKTVTSEGSTDFTYAYDDAGNMVEQIKDDQTTDTYTRTVYTYDDRGYVLEEKTYNKEDVLQGSISYTYESDDSGRTDTYYDGDGAPTGEVVTTQYDANGNLVLETATVDGEVVQTIAYTYEALEIPVEE